LWVNLCSIGHYGIILSIPFFPFLSFLNFFPIIPILPFFLYSSIGRNPTSFQLTFLKNSIGLLELGINPFLLLPLIRAVEGPFWETLP